MQLFCEMCKDDGNVMVMLLMADDLSSAEWYPVSDIFYLARVTQLVTAVASAAEHT